MAGKIAWCQTSHGKFGKKKKREEIQSNALPSCQYFFIKFATINRVVLTILISFFVWWLFAIIGIEIYSGSFGVCRAPVTFNATMVEEVKPKIFHLFCE